MYRHAVAVGPTDNGRVVAPSHFARERGVPALVAPWKCRMLESIHLEGVGPAETMDLAFGPRLNLLTGDNGLGKTFALDIAWWALTRSWAGQPAAPRPGAISPTINYHAAGTVAAGGTGFHGVYKRSTQSWSNDWSNPLPSLGIYARIDGGFSIWDPARNYWPPRGDLGAPAEWDAPAAFNFTPSDVWNGLAPPGGRVLSNGLLRDWITWQFQKPELFATLTEVLAALSPHEDEILRPGKPVRSSLLDARDEPTLELAYGAVPLSLASAGMRRILALAYLLVWTWSEHRSASDILQQPPLNHLVLLIDEVEAHLHPQWQRRLLPALLDVMAKLNGAPAHPAIQIIATTHAPLILASVEPRFDPEVDRLITFVMRPEKRDVVAINEPWAKQGDAVNWLVSDVFGLKQARSREAERAIEAAEAYMGDEKSALPPDLRTKNEIDLELHRVLPGHDSFWPRWIVAHETVAP